MSSSPSSSLAVDFFGLSLVDTPPSETKVRTKHIAAKHHSRRIFDDEEDDDNRMIKSSDNHDHLAKTENPSGDKDILNILDSSYSQSDSSTEDTRCVGRKVRSLDPKVLAKGYTSEDYYSIYQTDEDEKDSNFEVDQSLSDDDDDDDDDPVWILQSKKDGYILNDQCSSFASFDKTIQWPRMSLPRALYKKLYPHQKIGVRWLASLHNRAFTHGVGGCVLGDDMGLGKTIQTLAYIGGLFRSQTIRNAIVVCPTSVVQIWKSEAELVFRLCRLSSIASIMVVNGSCPKNRRADMLNSAMICGQANPCFVITTYGIVKERENLDYFLSDDDNYNWDYVVLDEGQTIKNSSTEVHKSVSRIASNPKSRRLLLTGTPIQNNLKELWSIFDWVTCGKLFGKQHTFSNHFAIPIENGRNTDASEWTLNKAEQANKKLQSVLQPHLLQRLKVVVLKDVLRKKKELVVWTHLSESQRKLYEDFLVDSGTVSALFSGEQSSPLQAITWLKKLCAHPCLVNEKLAESCTETSQYIEHSAKLQVLTDLVQRLHKGGHRFLIFSQSTKMLDIIAKVIPLSLARIDGSTRNRHIIVDNFNRAESSFDGMLLSTKAAGIGLTLTSADRAIIYDPSWNPSDDAQATDRIFRIGQTQNVTVYRLIAAGTVEERMYEKQVQKDGISRTVLTESNIARIFSHKDWSAIFKLMPAGECRMIKRFGHDVQGTVGGSGKVSILVNHPKVVGITSHDTVYGKTDSIKTNDASNDVCVEGRSPVALSNDRHSAIDVNVSTTSSFENKENRRELILRQVDVLTENGNIDESLSLLLDATALEECKGPTRLMIHKQIAARASHLGFL